MASSKWFTLRCAGSVELVLQPGCETVTRRNPTGHTAGLDSLPSATPESSRAKADAMIAWFRAFAESRLNSRLADDRRMLPPPVILELGNQGFFGLQVPIELEGRGLLAADMQRVLQQLAAVDLSLAILVGGHNGLGLRPLPRHLSLQEQKRLIPPLATGRQIATFAFTEPVRIQPKCHSIHCFTGGGYLAATRREAMDWLRFLGLLAHGLSPSG